jgi:nucleotide-binding universal stress UspA family protein
MKQILVPVDFEPSSKYAVSFAATLARDFAADLHLLHVYYDPIPAVDTPDVWVATSVELQQSLEVKLQKEIQALKKEYGIAVSGSVQQGSKANLIYQASKDLQADLIVMGRRKNKVASIWSSTTLQAVRKNKTAILVVPEGVQFGPIKFTVLLSDYKVVNDLSCFKPYMAILERYDSNVLIYHVRKKDQDNYVEELPGKLQLARIFNSVHHWTQEVRNDVKEGLHNFAQKHNADLLVMIAHRHSIFDQLFGAIYTESVVKEGLNLPLLILHDHS